jgi:hypothetical protein
VTTQNRLHILVQHEARPGQQAEAESRHSRRPVRPG